MVVSSYGLPMPCPVLRRRMAVWRYQGEGWGGLAARKRRGRAPGTKSIPYRSTAHSIASRISVPYHGTVAACRTSVPHIAAYIVLSTAQRGARYACSRLVAVSPRVGPRLAMELRMRCTMWDPYAICGTEIAYAATRWHYQSFHTFLSHILAVCCYGSTRKVLCDASGIRVCCYRYTYRCYWHSRMLRVVYAYAAKGVQPEMYYLCRTICTRNAAVLLGSVREMRLMALNLIYFGVRAA
eukprot:1157693-Rhodomonas_salina.1